MHKTNDKAELIAYKFLELLTGICSSSIPFKILNPREKVVCGLAVKEMDLQSGKPGSNLPLHLFFRLIPLGKVFKLNCLCR